MFHAKTVKSVSRLYYNEKKKKFPSRDLNPR